MLPEELKTYSFLLKELEGLESSRRPNRLQDLEHFIKIVNLRIAGKRVEVLIPSLPTE